MRRCSPADQHRVEQVEVVEAVDVVEAVERIEDVETIDRATVLRAPPNKALRTGQIATKIAWNKRSSMIKI